MLKRDLLAKSLLGGIVVANYKIETSFTGNTFNMECDITMDGNRCIGRYSVVSAIGVRASDMSFFECYIQEWNKKHTNHYHLDLCLLPCLVVARTYGQEKLDTWTNAIMDLLTSDTDCQSFLNEIQSIDSIPGEYTPIMQLSYEAVQGFLKFVNSTVGSPEAFVGTWEGSDLILPI